MVISLIQNSVEWLDFTTNSRSYEELIRGCEGSSLILLPEMFSTGFSTSPSESSKSGEAALDWLAKMAHKYQTAVGGSLAIKDGDKYYNRFYVVEKSGKINQYDKHHLFTFAGEHHNYTEGEERMVIEIEGVRILLLVCYDLRFPVWSRNRGDYDVMAIVANWPKSRRNAWDTLLKARAIENVSYVCGVNIVGSDPNCTYSGGTAAINFMGEVVDSVEDDMVGVATLNIDMNALHEFRAKFPTLDDADDFEIKFN